MTAYFIFPPDRCFVYREVFCIVLLVLRLMLSGTEFVFQPYIVGGALLIIFYSHLRIVVDMQIHSAVCRNGIALVRTVLCIVPCDGLAGIVDLVLVAVVLVITNIVAKFLNVSFRIRERCVGADKELIVLLILSKSKRKEL